MVALGVDVVICAYTEKRLDSLMKAVHSVQFQTVKPEQIILVIDHNPLLAQRLAPLLDGVTLVENASAKGLSGSRNTGIRHGRAPVVAFLDDDAVASPGWLAGLMAPYADPAVVAVGGSAKPRWAGPAPRWFPPEFGWVVGCSYLGQPEDVAIVRNLLGSNMSIRRDVFEQVGGFSGTMGRVGTHPRGCEETELCIRATQALEGSRILYDPAVSVDHLVGIERASIGYYARRCFFEGRSKADVARLVGHADGTAAERSYTLHTLPRGVGRNLAHLVGQGDWYGAARAAAIVAGFLATSAGYLVGSISNRRDTAEAGTREEDPSLPPHSHIHLSGGSLPRATVVVPSMFERHEQLERCVESLARLDYPDYEVLVVDNRRDPVGPPPGWVGRYPQVRVLHQPVPGISAARNLGVTEANGRIVAFTDDDVVVDAHWLGALVARLLADEAVACVTGLVLPGELETVAQRWFEEYFGGFNRGAKAKLYSPVCPTARRFTSPSGVHQVMCAAGSGNEVQELSLYEAAARCGAGANMAFRVDALERVGGFDTALGTGTPARGGEDLAMFAAILGNGDEIVYEPAAVVHHYHRRNYDELVRQVRSSGLGLTAMLTALVREDPRHLLVMARRLPSALLAVVKRGASQADWPDACGMHPTYPPELRRQELIGMFEGPGAYLMSCQLAKRHGAQTMLSGAVARASSGGQ
ncbi:MAG: glycosyltransferase family 2 protein [Acidimicrobiales bacterium]